MKKDCTTCEFNFPTMDGAVCANQYYGMSIDKCMKIKSPCEGWDISFQAWVDLMERD